MSSDCRKGQVEASDLPEPSSREHGAGRRVMGIRMEPAGSYLSEGPQDPPGQALGQPGSR